MMSVNKLAAWHKAGLYRQRRVVDNRFAQYITIDRNDLVNFSSNDYLGLSTHADIKNSLLTAVNQYGFGSGASSLVSGYASPHACFEEKMADWLGVEKVLLLSSGYLANLAVASTLLNRYSCALSDRYCHASILNGIQLSRAKHFRFQHNNLFDIKKWLYKKEPDFIFTESVFSMHGDLAPVAQIMKLTQQKKTRLIIDDAHAIGVLGENGRGVLSLLDKHQKKSTCVVIPLGKAFNACGAVVAGNQETIEVILQLSQCYRYTTALPPAFVAGLVKTLEIISKENWRRNRLFENIHEFNYQAKCQGVNLLNNQLTPIRPVLIADNKKVINLQDSLKKRGFFVSAIRRPTVILGQEIIRVSINALHTKEQIKCLASLLGKVG